MELAITRIEDRNGREIMVNKDGSLNVQAEGTVKDSWKGNANETKVFQEPMRAVAIVNDDASAELSFTVGKITIDVMGKEGFEDNFDPFTEIEIRATGPYRAVVKG